MSVPDRDLVREALEQFVFDIVMTEFGGDDSDMDDQAHVAEVVEAWMKHWDSRPRFAVARAWLEQGNAIIYEHRERVKQALDEYDLRLTADENVRYLAHGASKSLELFDVLSVEGDQP